MIEAIKTGVLVVAHGTVEDLDELPAFLLQIRRGRPPGAALVEELRHRYQAIGGSPLLATTRRQAEALSRLLELPVLVGMRFGAPTIETALRSAAAQGLRRLVVLPLAPFSVHVYVGAVRAAAEALAPELGERLPALAEVPPWHLEPALVEAHTDVIRPVLAKAGGGAALVLTAHSLPTVVIRGGDPYADQVTAMAAAVAGELGVPHRLAYQSQGADGGDWLGPDLDATLVRLKETGVSQLVVAPVGFLSDHVETLYDLDMEARARAKQLELGWLRVPALNLHPRLIDALGAVARRQISRGAAT